MRREDTMTISDDWTPTERIRVATILLSEILKDIYDPTLALARMVLGADVQQLNAIRDSIEDFLSGVPTP